MFQRILVPLDGSRPAELAVPAAARIARASHGSIVFVHVVAPSGNMDAYGAESAISIAASTFEKEYANANAYLHSMTHIYAHELKDIPVEIDLEVGAASSGLISAARLDQVDLIVMCHHSETWLKHWVMHHTTQHTLRRSPVPVLILSEEGGAFSMSDARQPFRVLIPLDGSKRAEAILEPVAHLMQALAFLGQEIILQLLGIVNLPSTHGRMRSQAHIGLEMQRQASQEAESYLKSIAQRLQDEFLVTVKSQVITSVIVSTDVSGTILHQIEPPKDLQEPAGVDLIAMATHGREGLRRLFMGSVTERLLGSTRLPLLVVRPQRIDTREDEEPVGINGMTDSASWVGLL